MQVNVKTCKFCVVFSCSALYCMVLKCNVVQGNVNVSVNLNVSVDANVHVVVMSILLLVQPSVK